MFPNDFFKDLRVESKSNMRTWTFTLLGFLLIKICFVFMWAVIPLWHPIILALSGSLWWLIIIHVKLGNIIVTQPGWNPLTYISYIIINPLGNIGCLYWLIISNYNPPYNPTNQDEMITDSRFSSKRRWLMGLRSFQLWPKTPCFCAFVCGNVSKKYRQQVKWDSIWIPYGFHGFCCFFQIYIILFQIADL